LKVSRCIRECLWLLHHRRRRSRGDGALVRVVSQEEVAVLAPRRSPRVLDDPVGGASIGVDANDDDSMVDLECSAVRHDSSGVRVPAAGIDGNCQRSQSAQVGGHVRLGCCDQVVVRDGGADQRQFGSLACSGHTVARRVWVLLLAGNTVVGDDPLEGIIHPSTVATVIDTVGGALVDFSVGQADQRVAGDLPLALDGASGGKGPA